MSEPDAIERELARIDPLRSAIEEAVSKRDRLYEERAEVFLEIKEALPELPLAKLAERAGISVPAVIQQIEKARQRRAPAAEAS